MYVEIPATREKCRNLQEIVQEFAGISGICRNIRNLQEFAGIAGPWHPCYKVNGPYFVIKSKRLRFRHKVLLYYP